MLLNFLVFLAAAAIFLARIPAVTAAVTAA
jgi:hypothetical protein